MSAPGPRRAIRAILALCPLGDRRDDVLADVTELFDARLRARGRLFAIWRLLGDALSLMIRYRRSHQNRVTRHGRSGGTSGWVADVRYGLRLLAKHPALIGATVGGLALAIAVSTTVFTILQATVLRPYGMDDPATVTRVQMLVENGMADQWPYHAFVDMRDGATQSRVEAVVGDSIRLSLSPTDTASRVVAVQFVTGGYLPLLGGRAVRGRTLLPGDDTAGASPVVAVNHRFWTSRLGGDPEIVGKTMWLSGTQVMVVGVLEPSFTGPIARPPAFWAPLASHAAIYGDRPIARTSAMPVGVIARVHAGIDHVAAERELSAIASASPDAGTRNRTGGRQPVTGVRLDRASSPTAESDSADVLLAVTVMLAVVGLVLALACANVANLMLAGAAARAHEMGVRLALGASRRRILRQLLTESVLIGLLAGVTGLLLSVWLVPIVAATAGLPETYDLRPDGRVFQFAASLAVLSGLGAGLAPARHGARGDLAGVLKAQGTQTGAPPNVARVRRWFLGVQAAGSILLLVLAALFLRGALHRTSAELGFDADKLATVRVALPRTAGAEAADAYWQNAIERVRAVPSVEGASFVLYPPFAGVMAIRDPNRTHPNYRIHENRTDAAYFDTTGVRLLRGRAYTADEVRTSAPVAVISERLVRDFLGEAEPIGASLSPIADTLSHITIVGVAAEAMTAQVVGRGHGMIYRPLPPAEMADARLVVRAADPPAIARQLEEVLLAVNPALRPTTTLVRQDIDRSRNEPRILAGLSGAVAGLALLLSVLGVFGVTTFVVSQRMQEIQVRRALGASAGNIIRLLVRQSLMPVLIGLAVGLTLVLAGVRVLAPALSGLSPYDPVAILGATAVLIAAALAAVLSPAVRAARTNPASMLRSP